MFSFVQLLVVVHTSTLPKVHTLNAVYLYDLGVGPTLLSTLKLNLPTTDLHCNSFPEADTWIV